MLRNFFLWISIFLLALIALFGLQSIRFLSLGDTQPNFVIAFLSVLVIGFFSAPRHIAFLAALLAGTVFFGLFFFRFWLFEIIVLCVIFLFSYLARFLFTGTSMIDMGLLTMLATVLFYSALSLSGRSFFSWTVIVYETGYNLFFTMLFWYFFIQRGAFFKRIDW